MRKYDLQNKLSNQIFFSLYIMQSEKMTSNLDGQNRNRIWGVQMKRIIVSHQTGQFSTIGCH